MLKIPVEMLIRHGPYTDAERDGVLPDQDGDFRRDGLRSGRNVWTIHVKRMFRSIIFFSQFERPLARISDAIPFTKNGMGD